MSDFVYGFCSRAYDESFYRDTKINMRTVKCERSEILVVYKKNRKNLHLQRNTERNSHRNYEKLIRIR